MTNLAWTAVRTGVGLAAGVVGSRLSSGAWKTFTSKAKPAKNDFNAPIKEALAFAVLSAAIVGVITTLAERRAAKWMGMDKVVDSAGEEIREAVATARRQAS